MNTETNNEKPEAKTNPNPFSKINTFYLGGFKAFKDTQEIPIRPITLVFGPNSSGKSSIIQALVNALQDNKYEEMPFYEKIELGRKEKNILKKLNLRSNLRFAKNNLNRNKSVLNVNSDKLVIGLELNKKDYHFHITDDDMLLEKIYDIAEGDAPDNPLITRSPKLYNIDRFKIIDSNYPSGWRVPSLWHSNVDLSICNDNFKMHIKNNKIINLMSDHFNFLIIKIQKCFTNLGTFKDRALNPQKIIDSLYFSIDNNNELLILGVDDKSAFIEHLVQIGMDDDGFLLEDAVKAHNKVYSSYWEAVMYEEDMVNSGRWFEVPDYDNNDALKTSSFFTSNAIERIEEYMADDKGNKYNVVQYIYLIIFGLFQDFAINHKHQIHSIKRQAKIIHIDSERRKLNEDNGELSEVGTAWIKLLSKDTSLKAVNSWLQDKDKLATNFMLWKSVKLKSRNDLDKVISGEIDPNHVEWGPTDGLRVLDTRLKDRLLRFDDVGYGIQKLIPVLAAAAAPKDDIDIIAIEEPEMHLHPKLQSDLGDLFIDSVINNSEKTFILETHSENLLQRILRRVREGKISHEAISVLYVQPGTEDEGAKVINLRINAEGKFLDRWPEGFFEPRMNDVITGL